MTKRAKWILIVVVVAVALPIGGAGLALLGHNQAVMAGNEEAASVTVKSISLAQIRYYTEHGNFGTFDQLVEKSLLSQKFSGAKPIVYGYVYDLKVRPASSRQKSTFTLNADPESPETGTRHYYIDDTSSTVHVHPDRPANAKDPPHVR